MLDSTNTRWGRNATSDGVSLKQEVTLYRQKECG